MSAPDLSALTARLDALEEENRALQERLTALEPQPRDITPGWRERTCRLCGEPATVIDLQRPEDIPPHYWNGEGYCDRHAQKDGILKDGHPHMKKPGPKT